MYFDREGGVGFGHRRLSIIDLTTGHQPMSNLAENIWMVYNGEIYNFLDLKRGLQQKGYSFRTTSDTEVIIAMYQEYGESAFEQLNGIFALALFDKRKQCVILARDHFGVKPLYYAIVGNSLLFGSEIKAILQDSSVRRELDEEAFNSFLTFRYNPSPQTLFKGIHKLKPGHYLRVGGDGDVEVRSYWKYSPKTNKAISEADAVSEYQHLLDNAVRRQMIGDVPVGLLLSGGMDSAVIGRLMSGFSQERIKTFTVGFEGQGDYNELDDARSSAGLIGSEHYDLTLSRSEYLDFFLQSFQHTEEPIAETTIPALYFVSRLASQHVKVVLAGQGADEPLAGYHRYIGEKYLNRFARVSSLLPLSVLAGFLPRNERLKRAAFASQFKSEPERFLAIYTLFTPEMKRHLLDGRAGIPKGNADRQIISSLYDHTSGLHDSLSRILYMDVRLSLADNLLLFGDKMTMANSLEMRVPFLDLELVKFLETLPSHFKLKGSTGKYIHKRASKRWLPDTVIQRKKRGFATPMDEWLQSDLAGFVKRVLNEHDSACRGYFNISYINNMIDEHQRRRQNYQRHIFALLSFELWHKTFFENKTLDKETLLNAY
jgi:asparagine synthase (glutamine-hydrolysing)